MIEARNTLTNEPERRVARDFLEWRRELRTIEDLGAYRTDTRNLVVGNAAPESIRMAELTAAAYGGTLFLVVEPPPSRSKHWVQRLTIAGTRRDLGLGGYPFVGLAEARATAFQNRQLARRGGDPLAQVRQQTRIPSFRTACERVAAGASWKGTGPEDRRRALERYCGPIMDRRIDQIRRSDVIAILAPLIAEKPAAGERLHGEAREAKWSEVDLEAREWRIPAERMKMGVEHRVPLSGAAVAVLEAMRPFCGRSGLVFPSQRDKPMSPATMISALQRAEIGCTMHGFRSSFRVWAAEKSSATRDIAEMALAHKVGSDIERSYNRSDLFDKRRALMDAWDAYLTSARVLHAAS